MEKYKHFFIVIRYSVLSHINSWVITSQGFKEYKKQLFDSERLNTREKIFEEITVRSLKKMKIPKDSKLSVIIITSSLLPKENMFNLKNITKDLENCHIIAVDSNDSNIGKITDREIRKILDNEKAIISTIRLDDDDALSKNYLNYLDKYMKENLKGFVVSFPNGWTGQLLNGKINSLDKIYLPKIALGLAQINVFNKTKYDIEKTSNIYSYGNHTKIDFKAPVILDSFNRCYFRSIHDYNDSIDYAKKNIVDSEENKDLFLKDFEGLL